MGFLRESSEASAEDPTLAEGTTRSTQNQTQGALPWRPTERLHRRVDTAPVENHGLERVTLEPQIGHNIGFQAPISSQISMDNKETTVYGQCVVGWS